VPADANEENRAGRKPDAAFSLPRVIEAERVVIRPFEAADEGAFVSFMTDEEATRFVFSDEQKTEAGARTFFDVVTSSYSSRTPYFLLAIALKDHDGFVGMCGISRLPGEGIFECVVCLAPKNRRRGYATETVEAVISYCFENNPIEEFRSYISPENPRSAAIAKRLGMRYEGRGKHPIHGDDSEVYSISREAFSV
jgi:RimJ/RimL family protein N-acetyltransferase